MSGINSKDQAKIIEHERFENLRKRVLSVISHDYKAPIAVARSSAQLIRKYLEKGDSEKADKHLSKIEKSFEHIDKLIEDAIYIYEIEKIEQVEYNEIELNKLISGIRDVNQDFVEIKFIKFMINTHHDLLKRAIGEIISNSLKYGNNDSKVKIKVEDIDENVEIRIIDNNERIPKEDREFIFDEFYRGNIVRDKRGTGLGLSIARKAIVKMDGNLNYDESYEKGNRFIISLPKKPRKTEA